MKTLTLPVVGNLAKTAEKTGKEPLITKKDLVEFGDNIIFSPNDITNALEATNILWNSDPTVSSDLTNAITLFTESVDENALAV